MPLEDLPRIDEHRVLVRAPAEAAWDAVVAVLRESFGSPVSRAVVRVFGADPPGTAGWERADTGTGPAGVAGPERAEVGSAVPGFRVVAARRPESLVIAGRHRFSRYGIVFRVEPAPGGSVVSAESRGEFPGVHGSLYRLVVVGSRGHVLAVRKLLRSIKRTAQRPTTGPPPPRS